jgi:hypothetical protein
MTDMIDYRCQTAYGHELSGSQIVVEIPHYVDLKKLSHLQLNSVWLGEWKTLPTDRVKGFNLRAISITGMDQHVESFYLDRMTEDEIHEISEGVATFLGAKLQVSLQIS